MASRRTIIRAASLGLVAASGGIYAVQAGFVPGLASPAVPSAPPAATSQAAPPPEAVIQAALPPAPAEEPLPRTPSDAAMPDAPDVARTAPDLPAPGRTLPDRATEETATTPLTPSDTEVSQFGLPCGLSVSASAAPGAMVALDVMDPCQPGARVEIAHSGLTVAAETDVMGLLTLDVPAFESPAHFSVTLPDGSTGDALVTLTDLADYDRVGIQWGGSTALELHAMEFGAAFGGAGHIWHRNPGSLDRAATGEGGFVTRIGTQTVDSPAMADIYTFPRDTRTAGGTVRLVIEAPITAQSCGQATRARTLQTEPDGTVAVVELSFTQPGCDAVGESLVLQNLLRDLRVASN